MAVFFYLCASGGARFLRGKIPNPPGGEKDIAEEYVRAQGGVRGQELIPLVLLQHKTLR